MGVWGEPPQPAALSGEKAHPTSPSPHARTNAGTLARVRESEPQPPKAARNDQARNASKEQARGRARAPGTESNGVKRSFARRFRCLRAVVLIKSRGQEGRGADAPCLPARRNSSKHQATSKQGGEGTTTECWFRSPERREGGNQHPTTFPNRPGATNGSGGEDGSSKMWCLSSRTDTTVHENNNRRAHFVRFFFFSVLLFFFSAFGNPTAVILYGRFSNCVFLRQDSVLKIAPKVLS